MRILLMEITLRASWVSSLKEKRMIVKSIVQKLKNKFNISVSEIDKQDIHKIIVIGIAGICANSSQADAIMENIIDFIEYNSDAEIVDIKNESIVNRINY
ncbi:MAG: DUF503 domain-containing protein [Clostridium sp.]|jgi:uncharacterized protein YlxP (DUF503 family)|uniref:DUF503 domain-containing protein n=1 Tax=Clostridium sp. TaxID=1506 RepID=UPI0025C67167|nr:DUF503 domain-containing protein [Clostridium sp.]MCH3963510.1 DUF503 domain-containing protein [Clostridium sp.]MCI1714651.1 DUF503 domain-containing protein [Clostridium sp.]MCI1799160.1 DUF503 domain-containing protein [Clostridium sp.]MCI1812834.1 DUF503 domain-containing protein [Clostridium sp.]MCI1869724.1 DUF503 domain-containing protein [Clostridium sp.]